MISEQEALELVQRLGSSVSTKNSSSKTTFVDMKNPLSQWIFSSASLNKIDETQVSNAIDINISELKPNIPTQPRDFISRESYNLLLSQSIELNLTISELRQEIITQTDRIIELENTTENEINERTAIEQTNDVLLNQLEALSETINSFSEQIATALQKSVEESIFRTSLEAQNEGYKAQIAALISQIDSLNAIIKGLYAQLGAVLIEKEVQEAAADAAAASDLSWNVNAVVLKIKQPRRDGETGPWTEFGKQFYFVAGYWDTDNYTDTNTWPKSGWPIWEIGGGLIFQNFNNVPVQINITYKYPAYVIKTGSNTYKFDGDQEFFKFQKDSFRLEPGAILDNQALLQKVGVKDDGGLENARYYILKTPFSDPKTVYNNIGEASYIEVVVKNLATGVENKTKINIGMYVT